MNRFKIALLIIVVLSIGIFSLSGQEAANDNSPTSSEYGCLVVSQVLSSRPQYTWYEPSRPESSGNPPVAASDTQMASFLGWVQVNKKSPIVPLGRSDSFVLFREIRHCVSRVFCNLN